MGKGYIDVAIIGAGAAGMMCAARAATQGLDVHLFDHASKLAEKIRISGGGRCNFTNRGATWENYVSQNPRFARYALMHYTPEDFLELLRQYDVAWHEKHRGQLFCDDSSQEIIRVLEAECRQAGVHWHMPCTVEAVSLLSDEFNRAAGGISDSSVAVVAAKKDAAKNDGGGTRGDVISAISSVPNDKQQFSQGTFCLNTSAGTFIAKQLVIATGGMAAPAIGATDFGLRIARQFGLKTIEPRPALVPLEFNGVEWADYVALAGISLEARIANGEGKKAVFFDEDILFTHKGLSGPGILQISSYWDGKSPLYIDLCPHHDLETILLTEKQGNKQQLGTVLSQYLPKRLAQHMIVRSGLVDKRLVEYADKVLRQLAQSIKTWKITPKGTAGYKKAEAMRGGVDTAELDQKTMMSKKVPGLYFIGEVMDVTGWLGGYNFQWAWSSAVVCAEALRA